jgi:glycerophosphoryl diester phosphodiesterase
LIYAHRGARTVAPENTIASFQEAFRQAAHGIELDVKLTLDGEVVVIHDQTVNRTTNGQGAVRKLRLEEVRRLDAGAWFGDPFRGEKIPTLAEVFETFGSAVLYDVELTNYASPADDLPARVAVLIHRYGVEKSVLVSSFFPSNLARFQPKCPDVTVAMLAWRGALGWLSRSQFGYWFAPQMVVPFFTDLSPDFMAAQKKKNRKVLPWTVNRPEDFRAIAQLDVDGIITDVPDQARAILAAL